MKMKVQVIGFGVVGKAQAYLVEKLGHQTFVYDPYVLPGSKIEREVDLSFICTPEGEVEGVIQSLVAGGVRGLYVIKSTVPLGTTKSLMEKYGIHICHNPEFLRESHALEDVMNPSRIVIGECCAEHGDRLADLYAPLNKPTFRTDSTTSELIKLVSNSLRAVSISFWNELYMLCQRAGADIETVAKVADPAKVLGEWEGGGWGTKFFGRPYGGKCLPKDIKHLIGAFEAMGLNPKILEAAEEVNEMCKEVSGEER